MLFASCHRHGVEVKFTTKANHTLLIYVEGDNSLSRYSDGNIRDCINGLLKSSEPLNLVVYKDNYASGANGLPQLFQLKPSAKDINKIDTIYIKQWKEDLNSCDPTHIAEVLNLTFRHFNTEVRGVEFWSHGMSWVPNAEYNGATTTSAAIVREPSAITESSIISESSATDPQQPLLTYIGQDGTDYCQLWQLREALEQVDYPIDYIMFDACYMATAEVLYELRNTCKYILGSSTEIMGDGFPYAKMIAALSLAQSQSQLLTGLRGAFDAYQQAYANNGTFSLLKTVGAEALHTKAMQLAADTQHREALAAAPEAYYYQMQHYGRRRPYTRFYFYDLADWARMNNGNLSDEIEACVDRSYFSRNFTDGYENLTIDRSCGLAVSDPIFFHMAEELELDVKGQKVITEATLSAAYSHIGWHF